MAIRDGMAMRLGRFKVFGGIYSRYQYWLVTAVALAAYYVIYKLIIIDGKLFVTAVPPYLVYLLIATSAILMTISAYSIRKMVSISKSTATGLWSAIATIAGSTIASCGCEAPLIAPLLYTIGMNALEVSSLLSAISAYQIYLFAVLLLLNLFFIYYALGSIAKKLGIIETKIKRKVDIK